MRVAIGIDGSPLAHEAVEFAQRILSPKVDDLILYYSPPRFHLSPLTPLSRTVMQAAVEGIAKRVFDEAFAKLTPEMREVTETAVGDQVAATGLIEMANRQSVDLVVVGSKSARRHFPFLLGSTARTIVHHVGKPVLVVRGTETNSDLATPGPLRVVVACDGERWVDAEGILREFSWPNDAQTTLFHVTEAHGDEFVHWLRNNHSPQIPGTTELVKEYESATAKRMQQAETRISSLKRTGPDFIQRANVEVEEGPVVDTLLHKVERDQTDLLVISSRRLTAIGRVLGSVTESLLTRCPCSLLIVHDDTVRAKADEKGAARQASKRECPPEFPFGTLPVI